MRVGLEFGEGDWRLMRKDESMEGAENESAYDSTCSARSV